MERLLCLLRSTCWKGPSSLSVSRDIAIKSPRRSSTVSTRPLPPSLDVHLVLDNYGTHKHPGVKQWLSARSCYQRGGDCQFTLGRSPSSLFMAPSSPMQSTSADLSRWAHRWVTRVQENVHRPGPSTSSSEDCLEECVFPRGFRGNSLTARLRRPLRLELLAAVQSKQRYGLPRIRY